MWRLLFLENLWLVNAKQKWQPAFLDFAICSVFPLLEGAELPLAQCGPAELVKTQIGCGLGLTV
jgi:hypothetical protein